jgi:hypothetical protein
MAGTVRDEAPPMDEKPKGPLRRMIDFQRTDGISVDGGSQGLTCTRTRPPVIYRSVDDFEM